MNFPSLCKKTSLNLTNLLFINNLHRVTRKKDIKSKAKRDQLLVLKNELLNIVKKRSVYSIFLSKIPKVSGIGISNYGTKYHKVINETHSGINFIN